ncbi:MAG: hypothetical protein WC505_00895 [Patescibacteria group bacterium]
MTDKDTKQVEDIFAEADSGGTARSAPQKKAPVKPIAQPAPAAREVRNIQPTANRPQYRKTKIMLIVLLSAGALIVVGGGAVLVTSGVFSGENANSTPATNSAATDGSAPTVNVPTNSSGTVRLQKVDLSLQPVDTDSDGLTDAEEAELGTDIRTVDTDGDGLYDREEVRVYGTDPLQTDTDQDGIVDGTEVANGYDPSGPGMLLDLDAAIERLQS